MGDERVARMMDAERSCHQPQTCGLGRSWAAQSVWIGQLPDSALGCACTVCCVRFLEPILADRS